MSESDRQPPSVIDRTGDGVVVGKSAARTARDWARLRLTDQIVSAARDQLATEGAAALSLRAVARELGLSSSAVYRYFPSRDDLLTVLIVEAYNGLGAAAEAAEALVAREDLVGRWSAACFGVRDWALRHPHEYSLIYGTPVPGYQAPTDTVAPATRVSTLMTLILADGLATGAISASVLDEQVTPAVLEAMAPLLAHIPDGIPPALIGRGVLVLAALYGAVSFELYGQFHNVIVETPEARHAWFALLVSHWAELVGFAHGS